MEFAMPVVTQHSLNRPTVVPPAAPRLRPVASPDIDMELLSDFALPPMEADEDVLVGGLSPAAAPRAPRLRPRALPDDLSLDSIPSLELPPMACPAWGSELRLGEDEFSTKQPILPPSRWSNASTRSGCSGSSLEEDCDLEELGDLTFAFDGEPSCEEAGDADDLRWFDFSTATRPKRRASGSSGSCCGSTSSLLAEIMGSECSTRASSPPNDYSEHSSASRSDAKDTPC
mmetsp:Transcript_42634/g.112886  ORF Transcript_42634/g.112886 Transcript_42634/m.112886 type:complete len:230 (+) Transcript_42634:61-750(+)